MRMCKPGSVLDQDRPYPLTGGLFVAPLSSGPI